MDLYKLTVFEAIALLRKKEITAQELVRSVLERINQIEKYVRGYITLLDEEEMLEKARQADSLLHAGKTSSFLAGIPVALKDNISTLGMTTTCASRILEKYCPPYDAHVVEKLKEAGSILLGKTNLDEFAMGSSTENSAFFATHNPWDLERVPGGSSGGSAAVVAAGEALFALGSDTGGSIRQPASLCGVVGLKPTYGLVSRYGLIPFASSLDQIGPLTKDVRDCALVLKAIAGYDSRDSTSVPREKEEYTDFLGREIKGLKAGLPREYLEEGLEKEVKDAFLHTVQRCCHWGLDVEEFSLPHAASSLPAYYLVAPAEASSNLARYDGVQYGLRAEGAKGVEGAKGAEGAKEAEGAKGAEGEESLLACYHRTRSEGFGPEVKRRIMLGTYALSSGYYDAYYLKALKVRTLIRQGFEQAFQKYDFILSPTSPSVAFKLGEKIDNPLTMYLNDIFTVTVNLAGLPAISIPCAFVQGLPVGLQVIGRPFDEGRILQLAYALEEGFGIKGQLPEIPAKGGFLK